MTKKQMKVLAILYSANIVYNAMGCGASAENLTEYQNEQLAKEVNKVAKKMTGACPDSLRIGSLDGLVEYVKKNFSRI